MQLFEYYRRESRKKIECLEGRWHWEVEIKECKDEEEQSQKTESDEKKDEENKDFIIYIKWTALFEDKISAFNFKAPRKSPFNWEWNFIPINRYFGLISFQSQEWEPKMNLFWGIGFCWKEKTCRIGEMFDLKSNYQYIQYWYALPDKQAHSNSTHLPFLFYSHKNSTHIHCRLNKKSLSIERLGSYELTPENFDCLNLNGSVISGLANETKEIHQFDVDKKEFLKPIDISDGFPTESLRCVHSENHVEGDNSEWLRTAGAWSNDGRYLFVWTEIQAYKTDPDNRRLAERCANEAKRSTIYRISLDQGICIPLDYIFHQRIGRLIFGPDEKLYVRNDEFIGRGRRRSDGVFEENKFHSRIPSTRVFHFYRVSIGRPESLLFLTATKSLSKSLASIKMAHQILDKSEEKIPRHIYK